MRKPMTTKDLVQKFKSRNAGMTKEQMTTTIAQILKRVNPQKTKINDKLYLSIKKDSWYDGHCNLWLTAVKFIGSDITEPSRM